MITLRELNPDAVPLTVEMSKNLDLLHSAMNVIRAARGKPMMITSGVRSIEKHREIYMRLARLKGVSNPRIPMKSAHLKAAACDVYDPTGELYRWCKANPDILDRANVFCEEDQTQPRVHFQVIPFGSYKQGGTRWFIPY